MLNYGYIEAIVPCGQRQRAAGHAGAHTRVLGESFTQVASGFWVLRPVTGEGQGREVSAGPTATASTQTHTRSLKTMSNESSKRAESSQKPRDEHIISQRSSAALARHGRAVPAMGTALCLLTSLHLAMRCPHQQACYPLVTVAWW